MKALKKVAISLGIGILVLLLASWLLWLLKPIRPLDVIIVDKSVRDYQFTSHRALTWVLNENRFHSYKNKKYSLSKDYYGFVPLKPKNSGNYVLRRYLLSDITELVEKNDLIYYADMYGVYFNEWYESPVTAASASKIIGGINNNDYWLLKNLYDAHKTIIFEDIFFTEPTEPLVRYRTEEIVKVHPTGWSLKYFAKLDTADKEIPHWVVSMFKKMNDGKWPFKSSGIVFINTNKQVVVLEDKKHLDFPIPMLETAPEVADKYKVAQSVPFYNWIEIVTAAPSYHELSSFVIKDNSAGENVLSLHGIPSKFPAVLQNDSAKMYYIAGDFSNQIMAFNTFRLNGFAALKARSLFHSDKNAFLWTYYVPFLTEVFDETANEKSESKPDNKQ